jgi:hypothetical protein
VLAAATYTGLFDELSKLAAKEYRAGLSAHELGHAQDYEHSAIPTLRTFGRAYGPVMGLAGNTMASALGHPLIGAGIGLVGEVPTLVDEALATYNGLKALKESGKLTDEQLRKARNQLLQAGGTYASGAVGNILAGTAAGMVFKGTGGNRAAAMMAAVVPEVAGILGAHAIVERAIKETPGTPRIPKKSLDALKKLMKVKAEIYQRKLQKGERKGVRSEWGAFMMPGSKHEFMREMVRDEVKQSLEPRDKKKLEKILREGGVFLRPVEKKK